MLGKWKSAVDKGNFFGAVLTDLSKAFDCFQHDPLPEQLHAYGLSLSAIKLASKQLLENQKTKT